MRYLVRSTANGRYTVGVRAGGIMAAILVTKLQAAGAVHAHAEGAIARALVGVAEVVAAVMLGAAVFKFLLHGAIRCNLKWERIEAATIGAGTVVLLWDRMAGGALE